MNEQKKNNITGYLFRTNRKMAYGEINLFKNTNFKVTDHL